jgi:hypothetical protein
MGYGLYSGEYSFIPRRVPDTPSTAPRNNDPSTTRSVVFIEYDAVLGTGGAEITTYTVYLDDGLDNDNYSPYANGVALTWNSATAVGGAISLVTGRTYRLKYTATNIAGEGLLSPEVSILIADEPSAPVNLRRISIQELTAGNIRVQWDVPADEGGNPVIGYVIYLDG